MIKKYSIFLIWLMAMVLVACGGCKGPVPQDDPNPQEQGTPDTPEEPADLSLITQSVPVTDEWVWSGKPDITIHIENGNATDVKVGVSVRYVTDKKKEVETVADSVVIPANGALDYKATTTRVLEPGIYRASCFVNNKAARHFNFAIDPFQIESAPDKQSDFDSFWQTAKDQLAAVDMNANLIELPEKSSATRKVYLVEMFSVPDDPEGEPVHGYRNQR